LVFLVALCTSAVQTTCGYFVSSLPRSAAYRDLHSFPTRRSSDLPSRDVGSPPKSGRPFTLVGLGIGFRFRVRLGEHRLSDPVGRDRKSTRLNSSHVSISYAVFCLKKKKSSEHDKQHGT